MVLDAPVFTAESKIMTAPLSLDSVKSQTINAVNTPVDTGNTGAAVAKPATDSLPTKLPRLVLGGFVFLI